MNFKDMWLRRKIAYVDKRAVQSLFNWQYTKSLNLPKWDFEHPEELKVLDVFEDPARDCFGVVLYHPSFPELKVGEMPEEIIKVFSVNIKLE
jgi:hypothetical protein